MISDKGLYGLLSGVLSTAILQPLENIKMGLMFPPKDLNLRSNFLKNMRQAYNYILKTDGCAGFFKGSTAAVIKAGMGCYIYFATLRYLQSQRQSSFMDFIHSSLARVLSAILTNPLGIIQTRFELANFHQYKNVSNAIKKIYLHQGLSGFFSGVLASCIKEGGFAGFYYMIYELLKKQSLNKFSSGIIAGMIATLLTHPLEIIRARLQILGLTKKHRLGEHLIYRQIKMLITNGEWLKGLTPRIIKKPFANTLTFLLFQLIENRKAKAEN